MVKQRYILPYALVLALVFLAGCTKPGNNPGFARKALKCVYHGSLTSLSKHMTPDFENAMTNEVTRSIGDQLDQRFGRVRDVKLKGVVDKQDEAITAAYTVKADKGTFEMQFTTDKYDRIAGISFPVLIGQ